MFDRHALEAVSNGPVVTEHSFFGVQTHGVQEVVCLTAN